MRSALLLAVLLVSGAPHRFTGRAAGRAPRDDGAEGRGRYLANDVAQCAQCHTPRDARGALDASRAFAGAAIPVRGPEFLADWAARAPALAGLAGAKAERALRVLTGEYLPGERRPAPPMPAYRLRREDAEAIVAYLHALE